MLFGSRKEFGIEIHVLNAAWVRTSAADRGPWAEFTLWVKLHNLVEHAIPGSDTIQPAVNINLVPIADWLVKNIKFIAHEESSRAFRTDTDLPASLASWKTARPFRGFSADEWDDERYEWTSRHFLVAADHGSWLPNVAFVRVEDGLWISWAPREPRDSDSPRFLHGDGTQVVPWVLAQSVFAQFVDWVGTEASRAGVGDDYPWARREEAFETYSKLNWAEYLNLVFPGRPEEILRRLSAADVQSLLHALGTSEQTGPDDSVAGLALRDLTAESTVIEPLREIERLSGRYFDDRLKAIRERLKYEMGDGSPEQQGYDAARAVRALCSLGDAPLNGFVGQLESRFGILVRGDAGHSDENHAVAGAHVEGCGMIAIFDSPRTQRRWARTMEIMRGMGHLLLDGSSRSGAIGAGSSNRSSGPRRRRSGTFAAEMVLPQGAMLAATGGNIDVGATPEIFSRLMSSYGAGARTTAWQLYNAGLLSSNEVVDDLIEQYGATDSGESPS